MDKLFLAAMEEETVGLDYFNHTGVGKINATYNSLKLISIYKPKLVVNFGTAGAIKDNLKGIVECTKFYQRDMDARALNFKLGETPYDKIKEIITSDSGHSCGSGDSFVNKKIDMVVDVVDMEAYAIAKVCKFENIEFKCFKYISDNANSYADNDWKKNLKIASKAFSDFIESN